MSKMGQLHADLDEQGIPDSEKNSALFEKVSAGLRVAEKKIDTPNQASETPKITPNQALPTKMSHEEVIKLVKEFVTKTHNVVTLDGKSYVKVAVWQFLASLMGLMPAFDCEPSSDKVSCVCHLYNREGQEVSRSTMIASNGEEFLKDKSEYAIYGMAQTRALSRAVKNIYGFIVEEAGYCSTPMEEINNNKKGE